MFKHWFDFLLVLFSFLLFCCFDCSEWQLFHTEVLIALAVDEVDCQKLKARCFAKVERSLKKLKDFIDKPECLSSSYLGFFCVEVMQDQSLL